MCDARGWYLCCNILTISADVQGVIDGRNCKGMSSFVFQDLYLDVEHLDVKYTRLLQAAGCVSKVSLQV